MGKESIRLLKFLIRYSGWTTYGKDRRTVNAVNRLVGLGFAEVNEFRQVRLANVKSEVSNV